MFEDSANNDTGDTTPICKESNDSSDEGDKLDRPASSWMSPTVGVERNVDPVVAKVGRTKISARELSFSFDRTTTASEKVATKLDNLVGSNVPKMKTSMKKLFKTGKLQKKIKLISTFGCARFCL